MKYISELKLNGSLQKYKNVLLPIMIFFAFGVILLIAGQSISYSKAGENYDPRVLPLIKEVRKEFFSQDILRYLFLILLAGLTILAYLKQKISFTIAGIILGIIVLFDLINIQSRNQKEFVNAENLERQYFKQTNTDKFILSDQELFRICPIGNLFSDNRWAYYHYSIAGYTPIKMYTIEELVENGLYQGWDQSLPINWNVLKITNTKYVLAENEIHHANLQLVHTDRANKIYTYLYSAYQPRGYFVGKYRIIPDEYERLRLINQSTFNPAREVLLEQEPTAFINIPDSSSCEVTHFDPNSISFKVFTNQQALFVISEVYYPPGWKISIDDKAADTVYKTNHAMQSIIVPAGEHRVELRFEPDSYFKNIWLASLSSGVLYVVIAVSLIINYKQKILALFSK
jgi:uncharacterized membrane protein YfhO